MSEIITSLDGINTDGLIDALSGIGGSKDILATGVMGSTNYITRNRAMLNKMYRSNVWVKKICRIPANYSVKAWRTITDDNAETIVDYEQKLNLKKITADALAWSNLYGGAMAVFIVDDGRPPDMPLDINSVKENGLKRIAIVDRWQAIPIGQVNSDILSDGFGQYEHYNITYVGKSIKFHRTRLHKFVPAELPYFEAYAEQFWGVSLIETTYRQLVNDDVLLSSTANMMKKATTDVFGIPGLADMIRAGREEDVKKRVQLMHNTSSTLNAMVIDAGQGGIGEETYNRITQTFAGFDAMDQQSLMRVSAAAEIPATIFLGKSPDGQNSTGSSDMRIFSDRIDETQEYGISPFLQKTDSLIMASLGINEKRLDYTFNNPFPKTEVEEVDIRTKNIVNAQALELFDLPNEVKANKLMAWGIIDDDEKETVLKYMDELGEMGGEEEPLTQEPTNEL